jgi:CHAT domain-containing protein
MNLGKLSPASNACYDRFPQIEAGAGSRVPWRLPRGPRPHETEMQWSVAVFTAMGAGAALCVDCSGPRSAATSRAELAAALGPFRPIEGRIDGLAYAAFSADPMPPPAATLAVARAMRRIDQELAAGPTLSARSAKALGQVAAGHLDVAAALLSGAAELDSGGSNPPVSAGRGVDSLALPSEPPLPAGSTAGRAQFPRSLETALQSSDLAAVMLALAARDQEPYYLIPALAAADRAVALHGGPAAAFNQALIQERLCLNAQSTVAWKRYLRLDPSSPWAAEAHRHLTALAATASAEDWPAARRALADAAAGRDLQRVSQIAARHRQSTRIDAEEVLLPHWAAAAGQGDEPEARHALDQLALVSQALREQTGDTLLEETAKLLRSPTGARRRALAAGHLAYGQARDLMRAERLDLAAERLRLARRCFTQAHSPFLLWVRFQSAVIAYRQRRPGALEEARALAETATARSYLGLAGRANWLAGHILLGEADPSGAFQLLSRAQAQFSRAGEVGNEAAVCSSLGISLEYLAAPRQAWKYRHRALQGVIAARDRERLPVLLGSAAQALAQEGWTEAALAFAGEVLDLARESGKAVPMAEAFWIRGLIHHHAGAEKQALADLREGRRRCEAIDDAAVRKHTLAVIWTTQGAVERRIDPAAAVRTLSAALTLFGAEAFNFLSVEALLDRGLAHQALGDLTSAEQDFATGIDEYERQRRQVRGSALRVSYFDRAGQIFDAMIGLQAEGRGRPDEAFGFAERAKARELLDAIGSAAPCAGRGAPCGAVRPLAARAVLTALPPAIALIEFHLAEDRAFAWMLFRGKLSLVRLAANRGQLSRLAGGLRSAACDHQDPEAFKSLSAGLFDLLLAPLVPRLPDAVDLVIVPDKELEIVPFAALTDRRTGRFVVQSHRVAIAASASTYLADLARARASSPGAPMTALAVGDPAFDPERFRELRPLPAAAPEAERIAALYPGSVVLLGRKATVEGFLHELDRHDFVHFAGHAVANATAPLLSKLILAPPANGKGASELDAGTIAALHLHRPRLVILSACAAGAGRAAELEGPVSLARSFLAAGVPAVLASLWPLEDSTARTFFARFYGEFRRQGNALAALQDAQRALLASPDSRLRSPLAWAGFQLFGAAALHGSGVGDAAAATRQAEVHPSRSSPRSPP